MTDDELFEYRNNVLERIAELESTLEIMKFRLQDIEMSLISRGHGIIIGGAKCECENCKGLWL